MKVKNIMFAGFAAAIFASVAGAANAAATYELASKQYVDAVADDKVDYRQDAAKAGQGFVVNDQGVLELTEVATDAELSAAIANEIQRANGAYDEKGEAGRALSQANDYTDQLTGDVASLKTDENLKAAKGSTDLTDAVKKLDAAITVASGDLTNVYTKEQTNSLVTSTVEALDVEEVTDANGFISSVSETDGKVTAGTTAFIADVGANPTSTIAPQTAAVKTYIEAQDAALKRFVVDQDALDEKIANKAATGTSLEGKNLDVMYPTVAKVQALDGETLESAKDYTDAEIRKVNSGAAWLEENTASKQYIVQTDTDGNEVLVEIAIIGANGSPVYTEVTTPVNTDETTQG